MSPRTRAPRGLLCAHSADRLSEVWSVPGFLFVRFVEQPQHQFLCLHDVLQARFSSQFPVIIPKFNSFLLFSNLESACGAHTLPPQNPTAAYFLLWRMSLPDSHFPALQEFLPPVQLPVCGLEQFVRGSSIGRIYRHADAHADAWLFLIFSYMSFNALRHVLCHALVGFDQHHCKF